MPHLLRNTSVYTGLFSRKIKTKFTINFINLKNDKNLKCIRLDSIFLEINCYIQFYNFMGNLDAKALHHLPRLPSLGFHVEAPHQCSRNTVPLFIKAVLLAFLPFSVSHLGLWAVLPLERTQLIPVTLLVLA